MKNAKPSRLIGLVLGPLCFLLTLLFLDLEGLNPQAKAILASTIWVVIWWVTDAVPLAVAALLPILLFPLTGGLDIRSTTAAFGHKYIFLYLGGFIIALTVERWNLHKRIALALISAIGSSISRIILGFMLATALLSMWISNTATAVMILPIGMAIVNQFKDNPESQAESLLFGKVLMIAIAYSASIGGMATLLGTPPNLVLTGMIEQTMNFEISFGQWFMIGFPISTILLGVTWYYLVKVKYSFSIDEFPGGKLEIKRLLSQLGNPSTEEKRIFAIFIFTAILWVSRSFIQKYLLPTIADDNFFKVVFSRVDDTIIAIFAIMMIFVTPCKSYNRTLLTWEEAKKLPWGVLLLFGGGLAIASGFESSGLALWIGDKMTLLKGFNLIILILIVVALVNFLTEITSNMATTAMLLPILYPLALSLGVHPFILLVSATLAASCAFMLPVATPPNTIVFGSGYLKVSDMVRTGIWLNILSIILITLFTRYILPFIWNIDAIQ